MKYLISAFIFLHGTIHLLGFVKGIKIAQISNLQTDISPVSGIFWVIAFLFFALSAIGYALGKDFWLYFVIPAIIISGVLIASSWGDTKFGIIPNLGLLMVVIFSLSSCSMNKMITRETKEILNDATLFDPTIITDSDIQELPVPVQQWMRSNGTIGKPAFNTARVNQKAQMKMKPQQQNWHVAQAEQYTTLNPPAFIWTVNMEMTPLIRIVGRDMFAEGKGKMLIKLGALINIVNEKGPRMDEGTLQRFLGELVWYPPLALSPYITWEAIDDNSAKATMTYEGTTGSGTFFFNEDGDFVKFVAFRFMGNKQDSKRYPWVLTVNDYAVFEGIKVPSKMEATWKLDEGDWTWLDLEITDIKYNIIGIIN